ncbi:hypothetical protein K438DRAFT_1749934 [Mycena galopus ATCC 62051]|nr:hypothetical protein K438DRAFT_1749934 [Mycena galopus ATCC 62051]
MSQENWNSAQMLDRTRKIAEWHQANPILKEADSDVNRINTAFPTPVDLPWPIATSDYPPSTLVYCLSTSVYPLLTNIGLFWSTPVYSYLGPTSAKLGLSSVPHRISSDLHRRTLTMVRVPSAKYTGRPSAKWSAGTEVKANLTQYNAPPRGTSCERQSTRRCTLRKFGNFEGQALHIRVTGEDALQAQDGMVHSRVSEA